LLWKQIELVQEGRYFFLDYKYGLWFWVAAGHSYLLLFISYIILFRLLFKKLRIFKLQAITLICAVLVSWIANILYLLEMLPLKKFDITPLALIVSSIFILWGITFFKTGDFIPIEITQKIDNSKDFSIVTDINSRILYISPLGENLLNVKTEEITGKTFAKSRPDFALHFNNIVNKQGGEIVTFKDAEKRFFKIYVSPLVTSGKSITGKIFILRDVTEQINAEKSLKESEKKYRNIFENLIDGIFSCSLEGKLIDVNPAMMKILGYIDKGEMLLNNDNTDIYSSLKSKKARADDSIFEVQLKKRDGNMLWVDISSQVIKEDNKCIYCIGIVRDIDEKKKSDEKIIFLNRHDSFTGLYNRNFFEEELMRLDKEEKHPLSIIIADINGLKLINNAFGNAKGDEVLLKVADNLKKVLRKEDILSRWGGDEFSIILPNAAEDSAMLIMERVRAIFKKEVMGGLELSIAVGLSTKSSTSQNLWETVRTAEDNMFRQKLLEKQSAHSSVIFTLEKALEERNYETKEHVKRMKFLVENFGAKLGLENSIINDLGLLASLHDIGKIAIADNIVLKSGALTDEEYDVMKKHSEIGYKIAKSIPELSTIAIGILTHHERWDGRGYPLKLAGDNIPLNSRIVAIIDSFDAMTNDRPYRKALSGQQAIDELNSGAGNQFDHRLVGKFTAFLFSEGILS
jgi:diguanylate cyclase (GGDEF)-like protein/PAS domain S-box-containing protein